MDFIDGGQTFFPNEVYPHEELYHYGTPHEGMKSHSGRYQWGSGENPHQHEDGASFLKFYSDLRKAGFSNKDIAEYLGGEDAGWTTTSLSNRLAYLREEERNAQRSIIQAMRDGSHPLCVDGQPMGWTEIGKQLGMSESSVRTKYASIDIEKNFQIKNTAEALRECVKNNTYVDVGVGTANLMGVTSTKLDAALQLLKDEGYAVGSINIPQPLDPLKNTTVQYIAPPGTTIGDVWNNRGDIVPVVGYTTDDAGTTWSMTGIKYPVSVDPSRLQVRYAEDGGIKMDGVIEIRPGVPDLSLGEKGYAQVRIAVDNDKYLKGMAIYADDLPDGVDLRFNTNKTREDHPDPLTTLKKFKTIIDDQGNKVIDKANPFGSALKTEDGVIVGQSSYIDPLTGEKKQSAINICREEGDWEEWSRTLSSQFLAKQYPSTAQRQLKLDLDSKREELDSIMALSNPEIKAKLLGEFADDCASSAVHLKAAPLPGQSTKVILPLTKIKDNEVYAPTYQDGEEVCLVRFPHGGTFEIPVLTVNNNHCPQGKKVLGNAQDAIGISASVAERLSGADFDGDTVLVIPTKGQRIKTSNPLPELQGFDPKTQYAIKESDPRYGTIGKEKTYVNEAGVHGDSFNTQREMGIVSNLITDMTIKNADPSEIARAVKHSMVVIDAEKHQLDHKQSLKDNNIAELKAKYQKKEDPNAPPGGASTLLSRAKSKQDVLHRREVYSTSVMTPEELERYNNGEVVYRESGRTYYSGKPVMMKSTKMAEARDAYELLSVEAKQGNSAIEIIYADYANECKNLERTARKAERAVERTRVDSDAKKAYASEVASLDSKINAVLQTKPYERTAKALASAMYASRKKDHPEWTKEDEKKAKVQAEQHAREVVGVQKEKIDITPREWEAIEFGALTSNKINTIIDNTDQTKFRQYATPRTDVGLTQAQINRIRALLNSNASNPPTLKEIANEVGVSVSTVSKVSKM